MNRYWTRTGAAQAHYDEMEAAGFQYTQATQKDLYTYYRYYNDGDLPGWSRGRWDLKTHTARGWKLTLKGEEELERRATARIEIEYARFRKAHKPA